MRDTEFHLPLYALRYKLLGRDNLLPLERGNLIQIPLLDAE